MRPVYLLSGWFLAAAGACSSSTDVAEERADARAKLDAGSGSDTDPSTADDASVTTTSDAASPKPGRREGGIYARRPPARGGPIEDVTVITEEESCANDSTATTLRPVDLYIMQDRSESMLEPTASADSKWDVITRAVRAFVEDPRSHALGGGLGFFGNAGLSDTSCAPSEYEQPAVPLGGLAQNAQAIADALTTMVPGSTTPTAAALEGAVTYATDWAVSHPMRKTVVVFATDGLPRGCPATLDDALATARSAASGSPSVETYVIGVFGSEDCPGGLTDACASVSNTNAIAQAGGTGSAFIVDVGADTEQQFLAAMTAIRQATQARCSFDIPATSNGDPVDLRRATVRYASGNQAPVDLPWTATRRDCDPAAGGWHYDVVDSPTRIRLCPTTCDTVQADLRARVEVFLACSDRPPPPQDGGDGGSSGSDGGDGGSSGGGGTGGTRECVPAGQSCGQGDVCCVGACIGERCQQVR